MTSFRTQGADKLAGALGGKDPSVPLSKNAHLLNWVEKMANLTKPDAIHWVDGSPEEDEALKAQMVASGTFIKLNEEPGPAVTTRVPTPAMSLGSRTARSSVHFQKMPRVPRTTGKSRLRCAGN